MSDFTIEYFEECVSNEYYIDNVGGYEQVFGDERTWPTCSCHAYKFFKNGKTNFNGRYFPNLCKHLKEAQKNRCGWHQAYSDEIQLEKGICPKCGKETRKVRFAV